MIKRTFTLYTDPGHGWLKVPRSLLSLLNLHNKVTRYSYERGEFAYLEEDVDAPMLLNKLKENKVKVTIIEKHTDRSSRIRTYNRYQMR